MASIRYWADEVEIFADTEIVEGYAGVWVTNGTKGNKEREAIIASTMHQVSVFPSGGSTVVLKLAFMPAGGEISDAVYVKDEDGVDISIDTATIQNGSASYIFEASAAMIALLPQGVNAEGESFDVHYSCW